jgi:hypothetical protein
VVRGVVVGHLLVWRLWPWWQKITSLRDHHQHLDGAGAITSEKAKGYGFEAVSTRCGPACGHHGGATALQVGGHRLSCTPLPIPCPEPGR